MLHLHSLFAMTTMDLSSLRLYPLSDFHFKGLERPTPIVASCVFCNCENSKGIHVLSNSYPEISQELLTIFLRLSVHNGEVGQLCKRLRVTEIGKSIHQGLNHLDNKIIATDSFDNHIGTTFGELAQICKEDKTLPHFHSFLNIFKFLSQTLITSFFLNLVISESDICSHTSWRKLMEAK